jgi:hypothetical protein
VAKTKYYAEITCQSVGITADAFPKEIDKVASALFAIPGGAGASFTGSVRDLTVTFGFMISAANRKSAMEKATAIARAALHAASEAGTQPGAAEQGDWPEGYVAVAESVHTEREALKAA